MNIELKLPLPFNGIEWVRANAPDQHGLSETRELSAQGKYEAATWALLHSANICADGKPLINLDHKDKFPWKSAEFVMMEILKAMGCEMMLADEHNCPYCGTRVACIVDGDEDLRINLDDLPVRHGDEGQVYKVSGFNEETVRKRIKHTSAFKSAEDYDRYVRSLTFVRHISTESVILEVKSMTFRAPTVGDMTHAATRAKSMSDFGEILRWRTLVDAEFEFVHGPNDVADFAEMKRVCGNMQGGLTAFNWHVYGDIYNDRINSHGLIPALSTRCGRCRSEYEQYLSLRDFFGSALLSDFGTWRAIDRQTADR